MKKIVLSICFLIALTINLYAVVLSNHDINSIMDKFSVIDALKKSVPNEANEILRDVQSEHGGKDNFHPIFGERYDQLKNEIRRNLNPAPAKITTYFHHIAISASNPGRFPELAKKTLAGLEAKLHIDPTKTSKEALEEALNNQKHQLLQGTLSANDIEKARLKVDHINIRSGVNGSFSSRVDKRALNMPPEALGLHEPDIISGSLLSITIE